MNIVVAGGSGFLGRVLRTHLAASGYHVTNLSRNPAGDGGVGESVAWDGETLGRWQDRLEGADVLINLSGKSVDCRYTPRNKQAIYDSRLNSTRVLGGAVAACSNPPRRWLNAASATIYRHAEDHDMDEATGELGTGFSVDVCQRWERTFFEAAVPDSVRRVALRIAIVLGRDGGALVPLRTLTRLGLGGRQGNGRQYVSWLHERDFVGIVDYLIAREDIQGAVNVTAPVPVPNATFMAALRKACGAPFGLPQPAWLLEMGAVFIRTETELVLKSRRVVPARLLEAGYAFRFGELDAALADLLGGMPHGG